VRFVAWQSIRCAIVAQFISMTKGIPLVLRHANIESQYALTNRWRTLRIRRPVAKSMTAAFSLSKTCAFRAARSSAAALRAGRSICPIDRMGNANRLWRWRRYISHAA
jgi:hypothetical protein